MKQPRDVAKTRTMKRYLTPSTILATTALFFALGGAAYATNRYVITSTSQVKPSVIKALHGDQGTIGNTGLAGTNGISGNVGASGATGAAGIAGVTGATGAAGAIGATGDTGPRGYNGAEGDKGAPGANGAQGDTGAQGDPGATGTNGIDGINGVDGTNGVNGLNPATPVLQSGDAGWTFSGVDPVTGNGAAFQGGALHLYGGFDGTTYQGGIGLAKSYSDALSTFSALGYSYVINQSANADQPVVHVTLIGATADSKFASGFTNLVYVPAFNGATGRDGTVDGFAQGNEWYSTDEPGGLSAPGALNNPRPISFFQTNEPNATIIQISIDNGNSSNGTIPYGSEDFSADALIVGFGGSFTRYDLGG